jgi:hypothetical protein
MRLKPSESVFKEQQVVFKVESTQGENAGQPASNQTGHQSSNQPRHEPRNEPKEKAVSKWLTVKPRREKPRRE